MADLDVRERESEEGTETERETGKKREGGTAGDLMKSHHVLSGGLF